MRLCRIAIAKPSRLLSRSRFGCSKQLQQEGYMFPIYIDQFCQHESELQKEIRPRLSQAFMPVTATKLLQRAGPFFAWHMVRWSEICLQRPARLKKRPRNLSFCAVFHVLQYAVTCCIDPALATSTLQPSAAVTFAVRLSSLGILLC